MDNEQLGGAAVSDDWGSWESAHTRKITFALDATPAERLAWLEEVIRLAHACGALPRSEATVSDRW
jgi:hypothetical protein